MAARFKNFTLEGKAFDVTAYIAPDGKTAYTFELHSEFDKEGLTWEELEAFRRALKDDVSWDGMMMDGELEDFEERWGEDV